MLTCDAYLRPRSLNEAFAAMAEHAGRFRLIAGATDILPWAREGRAGDVDIPVLIDIAGIPELRERAVKDGRVHFGAATPMQRFLDDAELVGALPVMPRCAVWFADDQIRESATIGGNLVNASPAADGTPPLLAHDAVLELASSRNGLIARRTVKLADFVVGPGKTTMQGDEILVGVTCKALNGYGGSFEKVGHRRSLVISTVCLATLIKLDASRRRIADARLAIGGIGPVPVRLRDVEAALRDREISADLFGQVADMPVSYVQSRTRQTYRRDVVRGFVVRGLFNAADRAGADRAVLTPELEAKYA